ncbi:trypsin-like serine protease [Kitasatospora sp. NPDC004240]
MTLKARRTLTAAAITLTALGATPVADAAAEPTPNAAAPLASESFAYPNADEVLAQTGAKLIRGNGGITHTSCAQPHEIEVWARSISLPQNLMCFSAPGASGYLALSVPGAFRLATYGRDLHASVTTSGGNQTVDVPRDTFTGIGEGGTTPTKAVLMELRVTGSSAPPPASQPTDPALAFAARLDIGGKRACSGALVDQYWVMTAASCFTDTPDNLSTVPAGAPRDRTVATVGRTDLANTGTGAVVDVVELIPRTDRDLVMARLASPVQGVEPLAIATSAPAAGQALRVPGYGRTATEWVPTKLHTTTHTTGAIAATGIDTAPVAGAAPLCQGDAGAPMTLDRNGTSELVAIATRSWQGGCLGTPASETRTGATATRVDDLEQWITRTRHSTPSGTTVSSSPYTAVDPATGHLITFVQDSNNHLWSVDPQGEGWSDLGANAAARPTTIVNPANNHVMVYVNGQNNQLWSYDRNTRTWLRFDRTSAGTVLAADAVPHTVVDPANGHLITFVRDTANHLWSVDPQGEGWHDFGAFAAGDPVPVANPNDGHIVVYVNGPDNRLYSIDRTGGRQVRFDPTTSGTVMAPGSAPVTVVDPANGHFTTFIRDTAHHLWSVDPLGPGWRDWGAKAATDPFAAVNPADNHVIVYLNGPDNQLNSLDYTTGTWTPFIPTPAGTVLATDTSPHTVVDPATGHLITFVRDTNNTLWSVDPRGPGWARYHGGPSAP